MKAAVYSCYGPPDVLHLVGIEAPTLTASHTKPVLVRVRVASVNPFDVYHRSGFLPIRPSHGWLRPTSGVLGIDVAGVVGAVGSEVAGLNVGDRVFGNCLGAHGEVVRARASGLVQLPESLSCHDAAALPTAALTALQGMRDVVAVSDGQQVLINGGSGGVGHLAVQIANILGADRALDYTHTDITREAKRYDLIYDAVGKCTYFACKRVLAPDGLFITENPLKVWNQLRQLAYAAATGDRRVKMHLAEAHEPDLTWIAERAATGSLRPVIERVCAPADIVAAHRHVEASHTKGKVLVAIAA